MPTGIIFAIYAKFEYFGPRFAPIIEELTRFPFSRNFAVGLSGFVLTSSSAKIESDDVLSVAGMVLAGGRKFLKREFLKLCIPKMSGNLPYSETVFWMPNRCAKSYVKKVLL